MGDPWLSIEQSREISDSPDIKVRTSLTLHKQRMGDPYSLDEKEERSQTRQIQRMGDPWLSIEKGREIPDSPDAKIGRYLTLQIES